MPGPLSHEKLQSLRRHVRKLGYHGSKDDVLCLLATLDKVKSEQREYETWRANNEDRILDAARTYLDDLGATHWPAVSWTIKGSPDSLNEAATWLSKRVQAVLKEMETK